MIRKGIHQSALIDFDGDLVLPSSIIIEPLVSIYGSKNAKLVFGEMNTIYPGCSIRIDKGQMITGDEVSFGPGCHIYEPRGSLSIGSNCMIGGGCLISGVNHGYSELNIPMRLQMSQELPIMIEDNVWIGMRVVILPGVRIGCGSIIGAGSVVTKDISPYSIAMGSPCRVIKKRLKNL